MKFIIISCLILFGASFGFAGDGQSVPIPSQEVRFFKDATGYHIATSDGLLEMTIYEYFRPAKYIKINLKQIENTCNPHQDLSTCEFNVGIAPFHYLMIWTKHVDPNKIGTLVEDGKLSQNFFYYNTLEVPALKELFTPDHLACNSYAWMAGMKKNSMGSFVVDSWSSELMFQNLESGVNENQTFSNGFEVLLKPLQRDFEVESVRSDYSPLGALIPPYLSSQVSNINFLNNNNEACQVSFESSVSNDRSASDGSYFTEIDMKNIRPTTELFPALYQDLKGKIRSSIQNLKNTLSVQGGSK
ncbi:MAG: hypothetical protein ACXVCP_04870 [Bdellovibrio sp.]